MRLALRTVWSSAYVRVAVLMVAALGLYLLLMKALDVLIIFFLAFLLAYLMYPVVAWCERRLHARWLGLLLFFVVFMLGVGFTSVLIADLAGQIASFAGQLPDLAAGVAQELARLPAAIGNLPLPASLTASLERSYGSLGALLANLSSNALSGLEDLITGGGLLGGLSVVVGDAVRLFALLALTAYMLADFPRISRSLAVAVPEPYQPLAHDLAGKLDHAVGGYFRGQLLVAAVVGVLVGLGLAIIGVPLALFLGFLAGVFNLVPYLGVVIAITPSLLLALSQGWGQVLGVLVVFVAANQFEAHLLSPLVLARATQLHPATVIVAILLGASLLGLWGAVLAVPAAAFLKLVYSDYYLTSCLYKEG